MGACLLVSCLIGTVTHNGSSGAVAGCKLMVLVVPGDNRGKGTTALVAPSSNVVWCWAAAVMESASAVYYN